MTSFVGTRFNNLDEARQNAVFSGLANTSKVRKDIQNEQYNNLLQPIKVKAEQENLEQVNISNKKLNNQVTFRDFVSGQNISVNLSNENLERLKDHFGSADFSINDKGSIVLNGEAQNFVSGWFGDIAYKRNFIGADIDSDGVLNDDEKTNLRSIYGTYGSFSFERSSVAINITEVNVNGVFGYIKTNEYIPGVSYEQKLQQRDRLSDTIEDELNKTLSLDKNLNGELSLEEIESRKQSIDFIKEVISNAQKIEPYPSTDIDMIEYLKKLMEELKKML